MARSNHARVRVLTPLLLAALWIESTGSMYRFRARCLPEMKIDGGTAARPSAAAKVWQRRPPCVFTAETAVPHMFPPALAPVPQFCHGLLWGAGRLQGMDQLVPYSIVFLSRRIPSHGIGD